MKIVDILEITGQPIPEDQLSLVASMMNIKLHEIVELMPDIIRTVKLSSYHTDYDLEAKLNNWLED